MKNPLKEIKEKKTRTLEELKNSKNSKHVTNSKIYSKKIAIKTRTNIIAADI
jgi:hypothetical protein